MVADERCPECHGVPALVLALPGRLVKRCGGCGHTWNERVKRPRIEFVDGWVRFNDEEDDDDEW